jgi:hypothetical protein
MQPIYDAKEAIDMRNKQRQHLQMDFRGAAAAEVIADELTMMRAEMTVMRGLLAQIAAAAVEEVRFISPWRGGGVGAASSLTLLKFTLKVSHPVV